MRPALLIGACLLGQQQPATPVFRADRLRLLSDIVQHTAGAISVNARLGLSSPARRMAEGYNSSMPDARRAVLSRDTSYEAEREQIRIWRSLDPVEIGRLVAGASRGIRMLALAGLRDRYPSASPAELVARLAVITLGPDLARRAYPELSSLDEP